MYVTISGDSRLEQIVGVIQVEMEALKSVTTVNTPPLKRGLDFNPYIANGDGTVIEYDFQEVLFEQRNGL